MHALTHMDIIFLIVSFAAKSDYDMLELALLSENSCNAVLRAIGRGVSQLFPADLVMQARINGKQTVICYYHQFLQITTK